MTKNYPPLFNFEESKVDSGYEALQDFFLSWTLLNADSNYKGTAVHDYAVKALKFLLDPSEDVGEIKSVKIWRQWELIDVVAEVVAEVNGTDQLYCLNIENKWYTDTSKEQLNSAKQSLRKYYTEKGTSVSIVDLLVIPDDTRRSSYELICKEQGYGIVSLEKIIEVMSDGTYQLEPTENDLFDEYWIHSWNQKK